MGILSFLFGDRREERVRRLAETLAAQCEPQIMSRLERHSGQMSRYEGRGYIRARSGVLVAETVEKAMADTAFARLVANSSELHELVMSHVVARVEKRLSERRHAVPIRRAA